MVDQRPDPDALLARVQEEAARQHRGRLKIFFGASAGVGKTFAMLEAAQAKRAQGVDVVVGIAETHGRTETAALLEGLEVLPRRPIERRDVRLWEFDLDGALARKPALILVDELAHTNAPGSRHTKRWQDIEELLAAGIDVYTTVNVQHLESLNDVVAQITEVRVRETVPDAVIEEADEVELVDLPPDELLQRLKEGKVYLPQQAARAIENFFRKGNLIALREMALRRTADRVDEQMRDYRREHAIEEVWPVAERILVCVGPDAEAERLVRAGKRMADAMRAEWLVVSVETPDLLRLPEAERNRRIDILRLAEELGGETVTLGGPSVAQEVLNYARTRNVSKIVVGKPTNRSRWRRLLGRFTVDEIIARSGDIDVYVISGEAEEAAFMRQNPLLARSRAYFDISAASRSAVAKKRIGYPVSVVIMAVCTLIAWFLKPRFELTNLVMVYLLGVVVVSLRFGRGPAALASVLGVAAFDFFFVPPYFSFAVTDTQYLVTFGVMLLVGLVISNLMASVRLQARVAGHRERRTAALYAMSRELAVTRNRDEMLKIAVRHVSEMFESQTVVLLPDEKGRISHPTGEGIYGSLHGADLAVADWVFGHRVPAGLGTNTLAGNEALYLPLLGSSGPVGVLAVLPVNARRILLPEQRHLLEAFAGQIALAIERVHLATEAQTAQLRIETERLRNSLLSAISHDLRTPLAVIAGSASSLAEGAATLDAAARRELSQTIYDEAQRMNGLVGNLLDMTRLESGALQLNRQWYPLEEIVGTVLNRMSKRLGKEQVSVRLPPDLPLLNIDGVLIGQVLVNLLDNALKYAGPQTPIEISAEARRSRPRASRRSGSRHPGWRRTPGIVRPGTRPASRQRPDGS